MTVVLHVTTANGFLALVDIVEQHADLLEDDSVRCPLAAGGWGDPLELEECRFELWAEGWPARAREIETQKLSHIGLPVKSLMKHCAQISENWHHFLSLFLWMHYLKPGIYLNGLDSLHQRFVYFRPVTVVKPQSQNPEQNKKSKALVFQSTTRGHPVPTHLCDGCPWIWAVCLRGQLVQRVCYSPLTNLSVSCRLLPLDSDMERKKPWTAGTVYRSNVFERSCGRTAHSGCFLMHGNKKYTGEHIVLFMLTVLGDGNVWTVFQGF